jgi:hypothetical protein
MWSPFTEHTVWSLVGVTLMTACIMLGCLFGKLARDKGYSTLYTLSGFFLGWVFIVYFIIVMN